MLPIHEIAIHTILNVKFRFFHLSPLGHYIKLHFDKRTVYSSAEHFRNVFASSSPRCVASAGEKTFARCWKAKVLSQHSFRRSIRLADSRWKEGACSTSLKVFLVGLGFAKRVTRSTGPSFSHGRGSAAADIPKASINSWPIPLGTSCASRPDASHIHWNFSLSFPPLSFSFSLPFPKSYRALHEYYPRSSTKQ